MKTTVLNFKMMTKKIISILFCVLPFVGNFSQTASFLALGDLPDNTFNSSANCISNDGSVIVGTGISALGLQAFIWTENSGMVAMENLTTSNFKDYWPNSVSGNGSVIVGGGGKYYEWNNMLAFRWTQSDGIKMLGSLDGSNRSEASDVSADGTVIVGDGGEQAFRWTQDEGMIGLGVLNGKTKSRAIAVSEDGTIITGSSWNNSFELEKTFIWTQASGMTEIEGFEANIASSFPNALSADGTAIAGSCYEKTTDKESPFRWMKSTGILKLGHLPGKSTTHPGGISNNGKIIVGTSFSSMTDPGLAFIWDSINGIRNLKTVLESDYGYNLTGWTLNNAFNITPDGTIVIGSGTNPSGNKEAYRVELKEQTVIGNNLNTNNKIALFPNPSSGIINIETVKPSEITITDFYGRELLRSISNELKTIIDLTNYPNGMYLAKVVNDNTIYKVKIVKDLCNLTLHPSH
jgi:uncharacterized membrane protein